MHSTSLRAVVRQSEVVPASWWNNQDPGRLLSQRRTLSGPCSGLLPFVPSTINISHLSCNLIGHAAIVAGCTIQCIRLYPTYSVCRGVTRHLTKVYWHISEILNMQKTTETRLCKAKCNTLLVKTDLESR